MKKSNKQKDQLETELRSFFDEEGRLNPRSAVQWARENKESALYASLDWDDRHAAEEHRIWQVRQLVAIHVVDSGGKRETVSLSIDRKVGGYRKIEDVAKLPDLRAIMLKDALAELKRVEEKYMHLQELAGVWAEADKVRVRQAAKSAASARGAASAARKGAFGREKAPISLVAAKARGRSAQEARR